MTTKITMVIRDAKKQLDSQSKALNDFENKINELNQILSQYRQ